MLAGRANGLLVQAYGIGVLSFETSDLSRHQRLLVGERRWIVFGPLAQLLPVHRQEVTPRLLVAGRSVLIECGNRQRGVVEVVEPLEMDGCGPKQRLRLVGRRERLAVVARQEPGL